MFTSSRETSGPPCISRLKFSSMIVLSIYTIIQIAKTAFHCNTIHNELKVQLFVSSK